jgi:small-conductance mechanosensitive channel
MPWLRQLLLMFWQRGGIATSLVGIVLAGCSENKATQCNRLIAAANPAAEAVLAVTPSTNPQDLEALSIIATTLDRATQQMQEVELSDQQLQRYQDRLITIYSTASQTILALIAAQKGQDNLSEQAAYRQLQTAAKPEDTLVTEVNDYCKGDR